MSDFQPNIILITSDQQRYDTCGRLKPAFMRTPHFDYLCSEGIRFEAAYADCPVCIPSRVSIMTGRHVTSHGMDTNGPSTKAMGYRDTLPAVLHEAGYHTCAIGKMHFTPTRSRHGFDEMILPADYYRQMERSGSPCQPMRHGLGQNELYPTMATVPESQTLTSWIAEQSMEYIRHRRDPNVPFFLWCSFSKPHPPLDPPEPYYSMYRNCDILASAIGDWASDDRTPPAMLHSRWASSSDRLSPEMLREARAAYYGLITQVDYNMGRVLAALQDLGLMNQTLIMYTSDHGEFLGDHRMGGKEWFHESSSHVPMALRLPKAWHHRMHGTSISNPVTHADILPTLAAAAGAAVPAGVDGQDLIALARGRLANPRKYVFSTLEDGLYYGVTDGRWKYIYYPEGAAEQLFDLQCDGQELHNLAGTPECKTTQDELRQTIVNHLQDIGNKDVQDGRLAVRPVNQDTPQDWRNRSWPGFHTQYADIDVQH